MIYVGIDSVDVDRFQRWTTLSPKKLSRIYSHDELDYCFEIRVKTAERLAVRFAAKEAFYKAIVPLLPIPLPFLTIAQQCAISYTARGNPQLSIQWEKLRMAEHYHSISLTHSTTQATAIVLVMHEPLLHTSEWTKI